MTCSSCTRLWLSNEFEVAAIPGSLLNDDEKRLLSATIDRATNIIPRADREGWKPNTLEGYSNIARAMVNYGLARGEMFMGTAPYMSRAQIACYYIDRVDEGEGVAPSTVDRELTVASHWWSDFIDKFPQFKNEEHPVKNKLIRDLQRRAMLKYQHAAEPKVGFTIFELKAYWHDGVISGIWLYDHSRLCVGVMWFFLARSWAAANIVFRGDYRGPIAAVDSDIHWNHNPTHGPYMLVELEKDKTIRDLQRSNRYLPYENGSGISFAKYVQDYIRHYRMPSGTYLLAARNAKGGFHDTAFTNWSRVITHFCSRLKLDRSDYGTQSCRRGCASWLSAAGLSFDQIGLLGFWLSDVVRRYTMSQAAPRLEAWAHARR